MVLPSCFQCGNHQETQARAARAKNKGQLLYHTNPLLRSAFLDLCDDPLSVAACQTEPLATVAAKHLTEMRCLTSAHICSSVELHVFAVLLHCNP